DDRDHQREKRGPDPVPRVPADPAAPAGAEARDHARPRRKLLAALEAVLLALAVRRAAARAAPVVLDARHSALPGVGRVQDRLVDRLYRLFGLGLWLGLCFCCRL